MDRIVNDIFEELGCTQDQTRSFIEEILKDVILFDRKQHDYGPSNISAFGEMGVLVRANDKMARLRNLVWANRTPENESVDDSWRDLSVYGVIARLVRSDRWID